jgi:prepilin-type N-terminal cleavage/methylation domain-containing protein
VQSVESDRNERGFTLPELVIVILLVGILAALAVRKMSTPIETARYERTRQELEQLARAIVGNPEVYANGVRTDYGYVGDVGSLPPDLRALVENPGYATWDGPYIEAGSDGSAYLTDAWSAPYVLVDTIVRSTGSGSNIDRLIVTSLSELFNNTVEGVVVDASGDPPGTTFADSISVQLIYPDGSGAYTAALAYPTPAGSFSFAGIPIGVQRLVVVYLPASDTLSYSIAVDPGSSMKLNVVFPVDLF